jgi:hypothetical protein
MWGVRLLYLKCRKRWAYRFGRAWSRLSWMDVRFQFVLRVVESRVEVEERLMGVVLIEVESRVVNILRKDRCRLALAKRVRF